MSLVTVVHLHAGYRNTIFAKLLVFISVMTFTMLCSGVHAGGYLVAGEQKIWWGGGLITGYSATIDGMHAACIYEAQI